MNKKDRKYYVFIVLILISIVIFESLKKEPIDWRFTLEQKDKIPIGTYVLFKTIKDIFPGKKIIENKKTTWEFSHNKNIKSTNFMYIADDFKVDKNETETLLKLATNGNNIFIAAHFFSQPFADTLSIGTSYIAFNDSISKLNFVNRKLKNPTPFFYRKPSFFIAFNDLDTLKDEVLAVDKENNPIFIRKKMGKGIIYLCTVPEIFTNYAMVAEKNYDFVYKALSYLPEKDLVWDSYYKPFRKQKKTALFFLFEQKSLKAAYFLLLLTAVFFLFFTAKRRQRIIPTIKPYENKTTEFVKTIGNLYYKSKNHKDIALKRFLYLNNDFLKKYSVNLRLSESLNFNKISEKTGIEEKTLKKLLSYYSKINNLEQISTEQLLVFNKMIEEIRIKL